MYKTNGQLKCQDSLCITDDPKSDYEDPNSRFYVKIYNYAQHPFPCCVVKSRNNYKALEKSHTISQED